MWTALYLLAIPLTNWAFGYIGVLPLGGGYVWHPLAIMVGLWLVLRDFAHRELGDRWIWAPMIAGMAISWLVSSPKIALASAVAWIVAESVDYAVFRWSRRSLAERVLISSAVSVPVDSVLFYAIAFGWAAVNPVSLGIMFASKMAGAVVVWALLRRRGMHVG